MAVTGDRLTFWFGCNMLRHAELIRLSMALLERAGFDVEAAGGPGYCCGTPYDHAPAAASAMAERTVARFNAAKADEGRGTVVTWCPSCHLHMSDIMAPGNAAQFDISHITEVLAEAGDKLAPLMIHPVPRRVALHRHTGFATHVAVNERVAVLLARIPGLTLVDSPPVAGHMCSSLSAVPGALKTALGDIWDAAREAKADTLATIFHSCHRELSAIDGRDGIAVRNWVQLVAESMGLDAGDAYRGWRQGEPPDAAAIARADPRLYARLVEPELGKAPPL